MKRQILKISNAILASILALFGVSSCEQYLPQFWHCSECRAANSLMNMVPRMMISEPNTVLHIPNIQK